MDPLAEVLALLRPQAVLAAELRASGRWSLAFDRQQAVKFGVVVAGECLLAVHERAPIRLRAGDVFLLGGPPAFVMASDLAARSRNANQLFASARSHVIQLGRARAVPAVQVIGGHFVLEAANAHLLVDALPPFVRIPAGDAVALGHLMPLLVDEVRSERPGRARALDQLAQLVLTYALRWLDEPSSGPRGVRPTRTGWLRALADAQIGAALAHIHRSVATGTSLPALARVAGMSRTAFASRFKELVGQPPLAYAIAWRMSLAKDALRTTDRPIGNLAFELGYASESAFSMAFHREVGCSPRAYRRSAGE